MRSIEPGPRLAIGGLLLANAIPLVGVAWFGWNLHSLLVVYWLESGAIGMAYVAKIRRAEGEDDPADLPSFSLNSRSVESFIGLSNRRISKFFVSHYGMFWLVHGIFVIFFFGAFAAIETAELEVVVAAGAGLVIYHGVSYRLNYIGEAEFEENGPVTLMVEPYRRVFVLHFTIVLGAFGIAMIRAPVGAIIVMVLVKTALDLRAHIREHKRAKQ